MAKPTIAEHATEIRAIVQEAAAGQFTDAEVSAALGVALNVLSGYVYHLQKVSKAGLQVSDTSIDCVADCPAESVVEIATAAGTVITQFRARGTVLVLNSALGSTGCELFYRGRFALVGTDTDWYPPQYRGAVCLLAAALLIYGRQREMAETDSLKANAMSAPAAKLYDNAIAIMSSKTSTTTTSAYTTTR